MNGKILLIRKSGNGLMNLFRRFALLSKDAAIVWSVVHEYLKMVAAGLASLEDILRRS